MTALTMLAVGSSFRVAGSYEVASGGYAFVMPPLDGCGSTPTSAACTHNAPKARSPLLDGEGLAHEQARQVLKGRLKS